MNRTFTCIMCPTGCEIEAEIEDSGDRTEDGPVILKITGATCIRGNAYVENELKNPLRIVASSIRVTGGNYPITSVRLTAPVPRARMMDVIEELRKVRIEAPVTIGQIIIQNILGLQSDVIITRHIGRRK